MNYYSLENRKKELYRLLRIDEKKRLILEIEEKMANPDFWQDREIAEGLSRKLSETNKLIEEFEAAKTEFEIEKLEVQALLNGPYDENNALLSIHAGAGGTEAQDWAEMLLRMFERWAEKRGYRYKVLDISAGEEAGIKSATIKIEGPYVFGWSKSESGVHRLVRLSPFDADHARHTSFALVEVIPEIRNLTLEIRNSDLRIDVYRASGHGGQKVNKTESAVRITHLPTGLVVACQNERSQLQNRETAMKILQSRLYQLKLQEEAKKKEELRGEFQSPEWGSQIRSYVLHPYKMVKDHRTGYETKDPEVVLNGDLDGFMEAYLKNQRPKTKI